MNISSTQASPTKNFIKELIQKDAEIKSAYQEFTSQTHGELIPRNHFFEWVGKKTLPERQVQIVHHFKSLGKFNDFHVCILTDKPMKYIAAESKCDGISGTVEIITVDKLNEDFYKALKDSNEPDCDKLHKDFVNITQLHNVGLENQALRSDYYRLALLYTYGGIHSDINIPLKGLDSSASALQYPLIPLRGKNGLLIRTIDLPVVGSDKKLPHWDNALIASKKNNQIILSMIKHMLNLENKLKDILIENSNKSEIKKTLSLHDAMRLWQCKEEYYIKASIELTKNSISIAFPDSSEEYLNSLASPVKDHVVSALQSTEHAVAKQQGRLTARHCIVTRMLGGGTDALTPILREQLTRKQYNGAEDFAKSLSFPLPDDQPSYANIKPLHDERDHKGLGSWYGKPNPHYVDDSNM
ncbi:glycosyltransferase [Endozoicomonas acroporae]|uniref:glycosyltransferase n=1 Tax=Endozoicomonas acroporae TaxID=1701104 RepID=UPI000C781753|nr:glycosyltransferase [Endozoicomonas acroporae]